MSKRKGKSYRRAAGRSSLSGKAVDAVASKWTASKADAYERRRLGTFGAAGDVVLIDPATYKPQN